MPVAARVWITRIVAALALATAPVGMTLFFLIGARGQHVVAYGFFVLGFLSTAVLAITVLSVAAFPLQYSLLGMRSTPYLTVREHASCVWHTYIRIGDHFHATTPLCTIVLCESGILVQIFPLGAAFVTFEEIRDFATTRDGRYIITHSGPRIRSPLIVDALIGRRIQTATAGAVQAPPEQLPSR